MRNDIIQSTISLGNSDSTLTQRVGPGIVQQAIDAGTLTTSNVSTSTTINKIAQAKPIFVVAVPNSFPRDEMEGMQKMLQNKMDDYHVLTVPMDTEDFKFKLYNATNANNEEIEVIAKDILNNIKQ